MNLNQDFQEFIELFISHNVRFMIVGGYAVAAHGHPRYTKDLDVWVWADPKNADRVISALAEFGFGELGLTAGDFLRPDSVVQLGHEPQRIDILTFATGLDFAEAFKNHVLISVGVFGISPDPHIKIFCVPRMTMGSNCITSDNHETDVMRDE